MAIVVEDGTIVTGANSYVSRADAITWAALRGLTLPDTTATDVGLIKAMDLIESFRDRFQGSKTDEDQPLQWPREDVWIDGFEIGEDVIPQALIDAQVQLAYEAQSTDLQPTGTGQEVTKEKVDVIEVTYSKRGSGTVTPQFNKAMAFLSVLLKPGYGASSVPALRV